MAFAIPVKTIVKFTLVHTVFGCRFRLSADDFVHSVCVEISEMLSVALGLRNRNNFRLLRGISVEASALTVFPNP